MLTPLWEQNVEFSFRGVPISQQERYFLLQLSRRDLDAGPVIQAAYAEEGIIAVRWWLPGEIAETSEIVFPENLSRRLLELHLSPQVASFGAPDPARKSP